MLARRSHYRSHHPLGDGERVGTPPSTGKDLRGLNLKASVGPGENMSHVFEKNMALLSITNPGCFFLRSLFRGL